LADANDILDVSTVRADAKAGAIEFLREPVTRAQFCLRVGARMATIHRARSGRYSYDDVRSVGR